jgi:hypothetical protein
VGGETACQDKAFKATADCETNGECGYERVCFQTCLWQQCQAYVDVCTNSAAPSRLFRRGREVEDRNSELRARDAEGKGHWAIVPGEKTKVWVADS